MGVFVGLWSVVVGILSVDELRVVVLLLMERHVRRIWCLLGLRCTGGGGLLGWLGFGGRKVCFFHLVS
jgi:hypothetical protein